ncbi:hypothetical protein ACHQM5_030528 [Ranunculus cassubicifolius]
MQADARQATIWNMLGFILLKSGRIESAISILSSLLTLASGFLDVHANVGPAYFRRNDTLHVRYRRFVSISKFVLEPNKCLTVLELVAELDTSWMRIVCLLRLCSIVFLRSRCVHH